MLPMLMSMSLNIKSETSSSTSSWAIIAIRCEVVASSSSRPGPPSSQSQSVNPTHGSSCVSCTLQYYIIIDTQRQLLWVHSSPAGRGSAIGTIITGNDTATTVVEVGGHYRYHNGSIFIKVFRRPSLPPRRTGRVALKLPRCSVQNLKSERTMLQSDFSCERGKKLNNSAHFFRPPSLLHRETGEDGLGWSSGQYKNIPSWTLSGLMKMIEMDYEE